MKKELKNKKGISLIVLVITIIIMIILATVVILSLSSSDIVDKARQAKSSNDIANAKDLVATAYAEWMLDQNGSFSEYAEQKLVDAGYPASGTGSIEVTENGTVYQYPTIPAGFTVSSITGETTVAGGLVIYEGTTPVDADNANAEQTTRNQFVWVPVNDISQFVRREGYYNGNPQSLTNYVEPLRQGINYLPNASDVEYHSAEIEQYNKMKESVGTYGGFYIGRYEAGDGEATAARTKETAPHRVVNKKDALVYNWIGFDSDWVFDYNTRLLTEESIEYGADTNNGCAKLAREAYAGSSSVTSSLLYGVQWDAALKFIEDEQHSMKNSSEWGNHDGNEDRSSIITNSPAKTGACEKWKAKNIYDMAGNVCEWTYEACSGIDCGCRVLRGGDYFDVGFFSPVSYRSTGDPNAAYFSTGFRVQLLLK